MRTISTLVFTPRIQLTLVVYFALLAFAIEAQGQQTLYSQGDPTPQEQYMLELINRARANPAAEGVRLAGIADPLTVASIMHCGVDLNQVKSVFASYSAKPPLAFNSFLIGIAREHSQYMIDNNVQIPGQWK